MSKQYDGYNLDDAGYVTDPGKFENEKWSTIALWNLVMDGLSDETYYVYDDEAPYDVFFVDEDFRQKYELWSDTYAVVLYTTGSGFVYCDQYTDKGWSFFLDCILPDEELSDE
jgi:hypothetical protein